MLFDRRPAISPCIRCRHMVGRDARCGRCNLYNTIDHRKPKGIAKLSQSVYASVLSTMATLASTISSAAKSAIGPTRRRELFKTVSQVGGSKWKPSKPKAKKSVAGRMLGRAFLGAALSVAIRHIKRQLKKRSSRGR